MVKKSTLLKKLSSYSTLATVVMAASSEKSNGQIIYHDIKPDSVFVLNGVCPLDLNGDDTVDFYVGVVSLSTSTSGRPLNGANIYGEQGDSIEQNNTFSGSFYRFAQANKSNAGIGQHNKAWNSSAILDFGVKGEFKNKGIFAGKGDRFIGLKFTKSSKTYYGWVRVNLSSDCDTLTVKDYAYNAAPGDSIKAGEGITGIVLSNPAEAVLMPSSPNPANSISNISYSIRVYSSVTVTLYDEMGRKIETLVNNDLQSPGRHTLPIDVSKLSSGIYFYELAVNGQTYTQKLAVTH